MSRYNEDLDYLIQNVDITYEELEEIIHEADALLCRDVDTEQKAMALLKKAQALQKIGNYDESEPYISEALELQPEMYQALVLRGNVYYAKKEYAQALENYNQGIRLKPDYAYAYFMRGNIYQELGEYDKAIEDYSQVIAFQPDFADVYYNRGIVYCVQGEYDKAIEDYSQVIALRQDFADAYYSRGKAYFYKGEYSQAIEDYTQSIALRQDFADAYNNRGNVYYAQKRYDNALKDFNQAIKLQPKSVEVYYNRGNVYYAQEKYDNALKDFNQAIEYKPDFAEAYLNRSIVFCRIKEYDQAFQDVLSCLKYFQKSQDRDIYIGIQQVVDHIIKEIDWDFIEKNKDELKKVPHFFVHIIDLFKEQGLTDRKYLSLIKAVHNFWEQHHVNSDILLYQYTAMPVMWKMFKDQRLRLSPTAYLNDPNEGKTLFDNLKELGKENANGEALKEYLEKIKSRYAVSNAAITFVRCLTKMEDTLIMWDSSYGHNGKGISVCVPASHFKGSGTPNFVGSPILSVDSVPNFKGGSGTPNFVGSPMPSVDSVPNTQKQDPLPIPSNMLGLFEIEYDETRLEGIKKCLAAFEVKDFENPKLTEAVAQLFLAIAPLVKSNIYKHEKEYRLVYIYIALPEDPTSKKYICQTDPEHGLYIETEEILFNESYKQALPQNSDIVSVYLGPKVDKITALKAKHSFQYQYGIKVEKSSIEWQ